MMSKWRNVSFDEPGAIPLFIDLHIQGAAGVDLTHLESVDEVHRVSKALKEVGVGAYLPSLIAAPIERLKRSISFIESARREERDDGAQILGIHLEGPFLNPLMRGAHPLDSLVAPNLEIFRTLISAGTISMMTISPELPGALQVIEYASNMGIHISLGHSNADVESARGGFASGADSITHIFNRCSTELARVALEESDCLIQIIADGQHVSDEKIADVIKNAPERVAAVTDSIASLHDEQLPRGATIKDGAAFLPDGTKAGSIATMRECYERILAITGDQAMAKGATIDHQAQFLGREELSALEFGRSAQAFTTAP
jgi:N-acetylglucosamine-6-phosphate deacetylase